MPQSWNRESGRLVSYQDFLETVHNARNPRTQKPKKPQTQEQRELPMAIVASETSSYKITPSGIHRAVCVGIYDLGTQPGGQYGPKRSVRIVWELVDENDGEKPMLHGANYNLSLNDKATLRKVLQSWRGRPFTAEELKGFDLSKLLGKPCMLNIVHEASKSDASKTFAAVSAVTPLAKGMTPPQATSELVQYSLENELPENFPDWLKNKITASPEWRAIHGGAAPTTTETIPQADAEDDVPF